MDKKNLIFSLIKKSNWCFVLCILLFSCSKNIKYQVGFFLHKISGQVAFYTPTTNTNFTNCFVLVIANQNIGIALAEPIYKKQAYITRVSSTGKYEFSTIGKGQLFELSFFCPAFQTQSAQFSQTIGVGKITYNPILPKDKAWKNSYSLVLRPFLESILTEPRYLLPETDSLFLSSWLEEVERDIF